MSSGLIYLPQPGVGSAVNGLGLDPPDIVLQFRQRKREHAGCPGFALPPESAISTCAVDPDTLADCVHTYDRGVRTHPYLEIVGGRTISTPHFMQRGLRSPTISSSRWHRGQQKSILLPKESVLHELFSRDHDGSAGTAQFRQIAGGGHADLQSWALPANDWTIMVRFQQRALEAATSGTATVA